MARGAEAKNSVMEKILETFDGAFKYDKEIRVPIMENGELVQIKVTLTCAKVNVENGADNAVPGEVVTSKDIPRGLRSNTPVIDEAAVQPSEQEKKNVATLLESLGLV